MARATSKKRTSKTTKTIPEVPPKKRKQEEELEEEEDEEDELEVSPQAKKKVLHPKAKLSKMAKKAVKKIELPKRLLDKVGHSKASTSPVPLPDDEEEQGNEEEEDVADDLDPDPEILDGACRTVLGKEACAGC